MRNSSLYHLSMTYITVYNLSINSNYRILAAELKSTGLTFLYFLQIGRFRYCFGNYVYLFFIFLTYSTCFLMRISKMQLVFGGRI